MKRIPVPYRNWQDAAVSLHPRHLEEIIDQSLEVLAFYHLMDEAPDEINQEDERWFGCEAYLAAYLLELCDEWRRRNGKDHPSSSRADFHFECEQEAETSSMEVPDFLIHEVELREDRTLLFSLNPDYYIELFDANGKKV